MSQCSSYTTRRSSYCIITVLFLYNNTVQLYYCTCRILILKNGPVTLLPQCICYTTKRSRYSIVTVQFLYYKSFELLYCHCAVPIPQNVPVTVLSHYKSFNKKFPVTLFSQQISHTTKRSSYRIVTVQFLSHKTLQLLYFHLTFPIIQNGPVSVLSQCSFDTKKGPVTVFPPYISYNTKRSSFCIVTVQFRY